MLGRVQVQVQVRAWGLVREPVSERGPAQAQERVQEREKDRGQVQVRVRGRVWAQALSNSVQSLVSAQESR